MCGPHAVVGSRERVHHPPLGQKMGPATVRGSRPLTREMEWVLYGMSTFVRSVPL